MRRHAEQPLAQTQHEAPRLLRRVQSLERRGAIQYEAPQLHYEFSTMTDRNSVMLMPAWRTILGTSDALVMPGMVLVSRKYSPSSARI